jgi:S-adenosylmethionine decarboxylase
MHFGEHITIDGYEGNHDFLDNEELVRSCFPELCALMGMHPMITPLIVSAPDNQIKDPGGWSGFVIIAESHISIHTFPKRRFISADVYTCQNGLDTELVTNYFKNKFELQEVETNFVIRGKKYPEHNLV